MPNWTPINQSPAGQATDADETMPDYQASEDSPAGQVTGEDSPAGQAITSPAGQVLSVLKDLMPIRTRTDSTSFRKPTTTNAGDFWYISEEKWAGLLAVSVSSTLTAQRRKTARDNLRRWEMAGLIMETDAGVAAGVACALCARSPPFGTACRVDRAAGGACA